MHGVSCVKMFLCESHSSNFAPLKFTIGSSFDIYNVDLVGLEWFVIDQSNDNSFSEDASVVNYLLE